MKICRTLKAKSALQLQVHNKIYYSTNGTADWVQGISDRQKNMAVIVWHQNDKDETIEK